MLRIAITGHARAGKDTAADYIARKWNLRHINFADALKADLVALDPIIDPYYGLHLSEALKIHGDNLETIKNYYPEWRRLCQRYGTDVWRKNDPNMWVERLVDTIFKEMSEQGVLYPGFVVGDMRFPNEREEILWNATIRIVRPGVGAANDHEAESYIDTMDVDYEILNDGTMDDFERKILDVLELIDRSRDDEDDQEEVPVPYDDGEKYE